MPLSRKFRQLHALKLSPDGKKHDISVIAREASRLYREEKILRTTQELQAAGVSMKEIAQACEEIRTEPDVVNRLYLSDLRDGKKRDVKWGVVEALSLFFRVETDFWRIGADATEKTRKIEREVELIQLGLQVAKAAQALDKPTESDPESTQGMKLIGALLRGGQEKDPAQVESIFRLALMALQAAPEAETG
jgi:DNA-binding transcriptional MerR regulator